MVYVVERYLPGLLRSDLLRGLARLEQEGTRAGEESGVRYLGSTIVLRDEACYCRFEGPTQVAIAEANRRAGLRFDRIVPAVTIRPGGAGR
jgi:Nickel responsive protein SCO4226-like